MANKKILAKKQEVIDEIAQNVKDSVSFVVFEYQGLTVEETNELRRLLRDNGTTLKVYKNTLVKRALKTLDIDIDEELVGPKAIAFGQDEISPAKILSEFAKTHPKMEIKIGYVDGSVAELDTLKKYAAIPGRDGLLTMFASGLLEPLKNFAICLDLHSQNLEK
jgi:large subunit ribosomal protein L10